MRPPVLEPASKRLSPLLNILKAVIDVQGLPFSAFTHQGREIFSDADIEQVVDKVIRHSEDDSMPIR